MSRPEPFAAMKPEATDEACRTRALSGHRKTALAIDLSASWRDRDERALLVLLAILADERRRPIPATKLAAAIDVEVTELDLLLHRLALRGLIWTTRRPQRLNHYTLLFAGESVPLHDRDRYQRWTRHHFDEERAA